jgi:MarR family 2-MHQ and catechol resistance regulon transcriptional repressor
MPTRHRGTAAEVRALDAYIKLLRAVDSIGARLSEALDRSVTHGQLAVLEALLHLGSLSQRDLARKLLRSNANVSTVIDNLEKAGLVARTRAPQDRRLVTVSLTPAGRTLIERVFPAHAASVAQVMSALTPDEQEQLGALCKKLGLAATSRGR